MAKKSSGRTTLKTLFSRGDGGRIAPARTADGEQKKPKLLKLRIKKKNSQRTADEGRHAGIASASKSPAEPVEVDHIVSLKKSASVYGTTPRSKDKEFSYSESDLRKPKRFATFSFGLKKRKKKNEEMFSKSTSGLDEQESLMDLAGKNLGQTGSNRQFSFSQPELDSSFDIPSPPPLAKNLSESYFALPDRPSSLLRSRPQSEELLTDRFIEETVTAPIAFIPELQLETSSSEETETCLTSSSFGTSLRQIPAKPHSATCTISQVSTATEKPICCTSDWPKAPGREGSLSPISESVEQNSCLFSPEEVYEALYNSLFPKKLMPLLSTPPTSTVDLATARVQTGLHVEPAFDDSALPRSQDSLRNVTSTEETAEICRFSPAEDASTSYSDPKLHTGKVVCRSAMVVSAGHGSAAAPVSDCVTSQKTGARVAVPITQAEKRSPDQVPAPKAPRRLPGLLAPMDTSDRPLSPVYLSVGSDEGSAAEVYYSAQEDNIEESGDEMFTVSERQESFQGGSMEDGETNSSRIVGRNQEKVEGQRSQNPLLSEGEFLLEHKEGTAVEGGGGRELVAPPVLQVSMMECESAPPPAELTGEGSIPETGDLDAEEAASLQGPFVTIKQRSNPEDAPTGSVIEEETEILSAPPHGELPTLTAEDNNAGLEARVLSDTPAETTPPLHPKWTSDCRASVQQQVPVEVLASHEGSREAAEQNAEEVRDQLDDRFPLESLLTSESESAAMMSRDVSNPNTPLSAGSVVDAPSHGFNKASLMNEVDSEPDFRWKNRFYGVTPYKPSSIDDYSTPFPSATVVIGNSDSEEWRRNSEWEEEPPPPAGKGDEQREGEAESEQTHRNSEQPELSCSSRGDSPYSGVFRATLVDLVPDSPTTPESPDTEPHIQQDMDTLVDTLRSMEAPLKRGSAAPRPQVPPPQHISSLPPIKEDTASSLPPIKEDTATDALPKKPEGNLNIPVDLGLGNSCPRDVRSPLELMKSQDLHSTDVNGNGLSTLATRSSRLNSSVLFGSLMSTETDNKKPPLLSNRRSSLPETRPLLGNHVGLGSKEQSEGLANPPGSRLERLSLLVNPSSLTNGGYDLNAPRMSLPISIGSPPLNGSPTHLLSPTHLFSPTHLLSPTSPMDFHRPLGISDPSMSVLGQSSRVSSGGQTPLFGKVPAVPQFQQPEPEKSLLSKYRAFPDAYLTKEKEHGKLNPRPGKMFIYDRPGMCGERWEVRGDVCDATSWELQETISIRVVRGGWVLYEKPNFKGEKIALDEGDVELTCPFDPPEEPQDNRVKEDKENDGETKDGPMESTPARRFIIGSIRRAVRDYSVPQISLFPEENAEGKKVVFRDTSEDARIFGFPIKATSIIVNAGLWLVFAEPFFQGIPRVLEVGGYTNPAAWGVEKPYVGSVHPLKVGEPRVENMTEPKMVIFDKPYFSGKSRTITASVRDFISRTDSQQTVFMGSVGSLKVLGGIWVGFQKEGFRGHQYLLEEGEYQDWRVWGGCDSELRSARIIRADLTDPMILLYELPEEEEEEEEGMLENTLEGVEAIPDVELLGFKTSTRSIHVVNGAWVAYSHVDFSGNQYILEKGFYSNCADWGSQDSRICSIQPIRLTPPRKMMKMEIILYSEPDFLGECHILDQNREVLPQKFQAKSCRVLGASWGLYDQPHFSGDLYVVSEGDYPNLFSIGCPPNFCLRSVKLVPLVFSVPSISLFSLECHEGREITLDSEIFSLVQEGFNSHILSVRVNSGCWVVCEHSGYRGRQFLLEQIEITNWPKFSSLDTIGSMFPIKQRRCFFRLKNLESGHFLSIQGGVDKMKSGRVVAAPEVEPLSNIWYYEDGLLKNKLAPSMSLQVMGNMEPAAKVVLWSETREPIQTWTAKMKGLIRSLTFPGFVLDVKGGRSYDQDHAVIMPENEERPSQQWEIELL